ncbi:MAG: cation-translocating P-type ATPase [Actinomycetota bacterium]
MASPLAEADCESCAERLRDELKSHRGLISLEEAGPEKILVTYDPDRCSLSCVTQAADAIGTRLGRRFHHESLPVQGMDCYDCAQTIERAVSKLPGVSSCSVSFTGARMNVEYEDRPEEAASALRRKVATLGYRIPQDNPAGDGEAESFWVRYRRVALTAASAAFLMIAGVLSLTGADTAATVLYALVVAVSGYPIARSGLAAARATHRPDINLLMTIAVIGAVGIGAWVEAALVVVLYALGADLESYAVNRARRSLGDLLSLAPDWARVVRNLVEVEIDAEQLQVGDQVVVRPGERIPADGRVMGGSSAVDQSPITGESVPVDKLPGDQVFAGTLNAEGRLVIDVDTAPGDTTLDRISRAVAEAQARKAPIQRWVDRFAAVYTPIVVAVAALTAVVPPLAGFGSFETWLYRGLAFLILACPCALVIATPVSLVSSLARASAAGVLVKGGAFLEIASRVKAVAFDKTGTLTAGRPRLLQVIALGGATETEVLRWAASLESASEHPLARAVVDTATERAVGAAPVDDFVSLRGVGVQGAVEGRQLRIGSPALFAETRLDGDVQGTIERLRQEGQTVVLLGDESTVLGILAMGDAPRAQAAEAVAELRRVGVERTFLLSGDHAEAAAAIGKAAGVDEVLGQLMPEDKVKAVERIRELYGVTAMVGDGVNDAPALARADLGVAMGTAGSPSAIEIADIALMGDDVTKVAGLVGLSRWTQAVVRQNIVFSLVVKAVAAVLAFGGLLTLWMAVLADVGATLIVVANGLRLLRGRPSGRLRDLPLLAAGKPRLSALVQARR